MNGGQRWPERRRRLWWREGARVWAKGNTAARGDKAGGEVVDKDVHVTRMAGAWHKDSRRRG